MHKQACPRYGYSCRATHTFAARFGIAEGDNLCVQVQHSWVQPRHSGTCLALARRKPQLQPRNLREAKLHLRRHGQTPLTAQSGLPIHRVSENRYLSVLAYQHDKAKGVQCIYMGYV